MNKIIKSLLFAGLLTGSVTGVQADADYGKFFSQGLNVIASASLVGASLTLGGVLCFAGLNYTNFIQSEKAHKVLLNSIILSMLCLGIKEACSH